MVSKGIVKDYYKVKDNEKDSNHLDSVKEALESTSNKKSQDLNIERGTDTEKQLEEKDQKIEELTDTLKRLQAEFENYKKRIEKEKIEFVKYAHADMVAKMLPLIDTFEIALKSLKIEDFRDAKNPKDFLANTNDKEKFIEGIKIIYAQLYSILEAEGLKPIKATGENFDPYKHEVLMKEESDKPEGTILEEFQKGYMLNDRILRFSKVKISGK